MSRGVSAIGSIIATTVGALDRCCLPVSLPELLALRHLTRRVVGLIAIDGAHVEFLVE